MGARRKSGLHIRPSPIRITFGFAIRAACVADGWRKPGLPTPRELSAITGRHLDLFPERWTVAQCRDALANLDALVVVTGVPR